MDSKAKSTRTSYFGLEVKAIIRMEGSSLIPYHGRKCVVEMADLCSPELSVWDIWGRPLSVELTRAGTSLLNEEKRS